MKFQEVVEARRSIRKFDGNRAVAEEQVKELIDTVRKAPTWKNSQTSRYYALIEREKCDKFREEVFAGTNFERSGGAALIITAFKKNISGFNTEKGIAANNCGNGWGYYDLGIASGILILKAREMGLDTLIMGIRDEVKIREMLNIPEDEEIVAVIALGYRDENPDARPRKEVDEILKIV